MCTHLFHTACFSGEIHATPNRPVGPPMYVGVGKHTMKAACAAEASNPKCLP